MINPKIIGLMLIVTAAVSVPISIQKALASNIITNENGIEDAEVDVAEAEEAGSTTMMTNQTTANGNMTDVQFLAIQRAQSGSLSEVNATAYTLELNNVSDSTILFADRPNRIVTSVSTSDFIGNWSTGVNSFSADEPNDALIVENTQIGILETDVIESFNPVYDTTINTLTYTIVAENATSIDLPTEFGQTVLVIDGNEERLRRAVVAGLSS
jgi:hypothetical protein